MDNKIRKYRYLSEISQQGLAELCGVSRETICRIEAKKTNPSLELACRIARHLGVTVEELFSFEEEPILQ